MKKLFYALVLGLFTLILSSSHPKNIYAIYNPLSVPNNKFGIHIAELNDLNDVKDLVNSNGGDWGYVTLVIQQTERDKEKWQAVFDKMRHLHLIPIVRIATRPVGDTWEKPSFGDISGWVSFLDSLNWVVKNRYLIIGNEPNHAKEWGGEINPEEYSDYLKTFSQALKDTSKDFFILQSGFDASAPNGNGTIDEINFISRMLTKNPDLFNYIDGWDSHSYPNPAFSGSPKDTGRGTIRTFQWEIDLLKSFGITKDLPVFITETGWVNTNSEDFISESYINAFQDAWKDTRIVAITPFIFNYQDKPFDIFSFKKKDGNYFDFYNSLKDMPKEKGQPIQIFSGRILASLFPPNLIVINSGQSIWAKDNIQIDGNTIVDIQIKKLIPEEINPGQIGLILAEGKQSKFARIYTKGYLELTQNNKSFSNKYYFDILINKTRPLSFLDTMIQNLEYFIYNAIIKPQGP